MSQSNIHATGLVLDKTGLILRGVSGAGKSLLALELIDEWEAQNKSGLERSRQMVADLHSAGKVDLSMLSVALRELRNLAR